MCIYLIDVADVVVCLWNIQNRMCKNQFQKRINFLNTDKGWERKDEDENEKPPH